MQRLRWTRSQGRVPSGVTSAPSSTHFVNVDLDLGGPRTLQHFIDHWGDAVFVLRHEGSDEHGWKAGLELSHADRTAEQAVLAFVELVQALPDDLRAAWDALEQRNLDVGIQAGAQPHAWSFALEPATLDAVQSVGAKLVCTVYGASDGTSTALPQQA